MNPMGLTLSCNKQKDEDTKMALNMKAQDESSKRRRKQGGLVIKTLRTSLGYTQRELAEKCELDYYTFISQIEAGVGKIPPQKYKIFAVGSKKFVRELIKFYDPHTFEALFDADPHEPTDYDEIRL